MRVLLLLFLSCYFISCVTQKDKMTNQITCPKNGTCNFEKHENKSLVLKKDDTKSLYYQMDESKGKIVFLFRYTQDKNENHLDGHYTEEILFELDNSVFEKSFKSIKPNKALFGVFCYCKEKAGYYLPENISISFDQKNQVITITIEELVENQVLSAIKEVKTY